MKYIITINGNRVSETSIPRVHATVRKEYERKGFKIAHAFSMNGNQYFEMEAVKRSLLARIFG